MFKVNKKETPNKSTRSIPAQGWMLHKTYGSYQSSVSWLTNKDAGSSADVVINKNGDRTVLNPDVKKYITWHAGVTNLNGHKYGHEQGVAMSSGITNWLDKVGNTNPNASLVGVEFVSFGEPVTDQQIQSFWEFADEMNKAGVPKPRKENTFYHRESAYWKEYVDKNLVLNYRVKKVAYLRREISRISRLIADIMSRRKRSPGAMV